jgi:hypothetical protein
MRCIWGPMDLVQQDIGWSVSILALQILRWGRNLRVECWRKVSIWSYSSYPIALKEASSVHRRNGTIYLIGEVLNLSLNGQKFLSLIEHLVGNWREVPIFRVYIIGKVGMVIKICYFVLKPTGWLLRNQGINKAAGHWSTFSAVFLLSCSFILFCIYSLVDLAILPR